MVDATRLPPESRGDRDAHQHARVLIVDDLDANVTLLERLLESAGFTQTRGCTDSGRALDEIAQFGPELVLLDLHMPPPDGFAILERIKSHEGGRDLLPVMVLTADATTDARDRALAIGADDYLTKPFDHTEVALRSKNLLRTGRLHRSVNELLSQTLTGSVDALLEVLSLASPTAFARATRIQRTVAELADRLDPPDRWVIDTSAALSQIGAVTLSSEVAQKLNDGTPLDKRDLAQIDRLPEIAAELLAPLPQLELVREAIRHQTTPSDDRAGEAALAAGLIKFAVDLDALEAQHVERGDALAVLLARTGSHAPAILDAAEQLAPTRDDTEVERLPVECPLDQLHPGLVLAADLCNVDGVLLLGRGHALTERALTLLRNQGGRVIGPAWIVPPPGDTAD